MSNFNKFRRYFLGATGLLGAGLISQKAAAHHTESHFDDSSPNKLVYQCNKADPEYIDHILFSCSEMLRKYGDDIELPMVYVALKRVLANLIQNAIKYSDDDIEVASGFNKSTNMAFFSVADHGPGINEDQMQHLFQPFTQGDSARGTQGSGLGLAIIKRIVDGHGGKITLHNRISGGLVATVELPIS